MPLHTHFHSSLGLHPLTSLSQFQRNNQRTRLVQVQPNKLVQPSLPIHLNKLQTFSPGAQLNQAVQTFFNTHNNNRQTHLVQVQPNTLQSLLPTHPNNLQTFSLETPLNQVLQIFPSTHNINPLTYLGQVQPNKQL